MNHLGLFSIGLGSAGYAVTETHSNGNKHVTFLRFHIRCIASMHTQHTHIQGMMGCKSRQTEQRSACRNIGFLKKCQQFLMRIAEFYALTYERKWALCPINKLCSGFNCLCIKRGVRVIRADIRGLCGLPLAGICLRVLGKIEHNRARTTRLRNIESTAYCPCNVFRSAYLIGPFTNRLGHTY